MILAMWELITTGIFGPWWISHGYTPADELPDTLINLFLFIQTHKGN